MAKNEFKKIITGGTIYLKVLYCMVNNMQITKNQNIELDIDDFTSEGSGVGKYNGMAVFVSGAAAGDTVIAHIIKVKKNYAIGKVQRVLKPSVRRIKPECPVFPSCGGCAFQHISYKFETEYKKEHVENAFKRLAHIDISPDKIITGAETRYRNKAQYPVTFEQNELKIGFYAPHTHRVINCNDCMLQPEIFSNIVGIIRKWIAEYGISVYNPETKKGLIRHIYLRQGTAANQIMVCLVINGDTLPKSEKLIERLNVISYIKSIIINTNREDTNVILGSKCKTLWGDDYIYDILCGVKIRLSPLSFYQVNHDMAEKLYEKAAEFAGLTGNETVLDMYCGTGTIGLSMAKNAKKIIGVEIVPEAIDDAKVNASENNIKNAEFFCGDAPQAAEMLKLKGISPDVIILDPPRKGCAPELLTTIAAMEAAKIVYVSCDPATLSRDCKILADLGYTIKKLTSADLFPRTVHVESVALLLKTVEIYNNDLLLNIDKIHTTPMGENRIRKNLGTNSPDVVELCINMILNPDCKITRNGKNWYAEIDNCIITVNAYSFTIITAHKVK